MTTITAHHGIFKDTKLHVDDTGGGGRPVVLIHGWPLSGAAWKPQVPALQAAGYRVITYDRRGFGRSDKPRTGHGYDTLADDLHALLEALEVDDVTLVGFSMGGGEVARYVAAYGNERMRSVVFASAVTPYLLNAGDNPEGPLTKQQAAEFTKNLTADQRGFYDEFMTQFFTAGDTLAVTEEEREEALALTAEADKIAALETMAAWATTDFRDDLTKVKVPALVIHGGSDSTVPYEGSGQRTHHAIPGSEVHVIEGGPHGCTMSHADEWNRVVIEFLKQ